MNLFPEINSKKLISIRQVSYLSIILHYLSIDAFLESFLVLVFKLFVTKVETQISVNKEAKLNKTKDVHANMQIVLGDI